LFGLMALLYGLGVRSIYFTVIDAWTYHAWDFPFLDTDTVLSAVRCVQKGIDVYARNPCDVLARVYDYSPLWLTIARIPGIGEWRTTIGLAIDITFLATLILLPTARDWRGAALITLSAISSAVVFATERGNNDLVIFVLAVTVATMIGRSRTLRLVAYGAALLAGLLKYYPMPLLMLATRERPGRFFAVAAVAIVLLCLFLAIDGHDLARALRLIPTGEFIGDFDMFGSTTLTGGLFQLFGWPDGLRWIPHLAMVITAFGIAIAIATRQWLQDDLDRLTELERAFLFVGAVLIPSFFFTAQNIGYRAIHLLLVMAPLIALWRTARRKGYRITLYAALGLLWADGVRNGVLSLTDRLAPMTRGNIRILAWEIREVAWWWLIIALISFALALLLRSEMGSTVIRVGRRLLGNSRTAAPALRKASA
jgi:Glycosyltransferase family 87